jgi:hypothetical protein
MVAYEANPTLRRQRLEDLEFKGSLGYCETLSQKRKKKSHVPVIPGTQEVEPGRIEIQDQLGQKVSKTPFQPIKAEHGGTSLSSQLQGIHN